VFGLSEPQASIVKLKNAEIAKDFFISVKTPVKKIFIVKLAVNGKRICRAMSISANKKARCPKTACLDYYTKTDNLRLGISCICRFGVIHFGVIRFGIATRVSASVATGVAAGS
jgi:hypothetical protein